MSIKKRIFNFVCIFIIAPIAAFFTVAIGGETLFRTSLFLNKLLGLFGIGIMWVWLILAYRYLVKMFDSTKEK